MANPHQGYNLFARELEAVLQARGARIGLLNDHPQLRLHPQLVQRLQISLTRTKPLVILNPEDLERVIEVYHMQEETNRLKAAVLATAVERVLMDRIETSTALMAANAVMHILREALENNPDLLQVRGNDAFISLIPTAEQASVPREAALERYDAGILELYLVEKSNLTDRIAHIEMGTHYFKEALRILEQEEDHLSNAWQYWYAEIQKALRQLQQLLLEEES